MDRAFRKSFLRDFGRGNNEPVVALFGKHPAWNDHMDDHGLATPSLRTCKHRLYLEGLAANAARQMHLPADQALQPYRHYLLWLREREAILLRIVESEDGRGRRYFPLVGAVHFDIASPASAVAAVLPALGSLVEACRQLGSRDEVGHRHASTEAEIVARFSQVSGPGTVADPDEAERACLRELAGASDTSLESRRIPVTRYDPSLTLAALASGWQQLAPRNAPPLLVSLADGDTSLVAGSGEPGRDDFWFLREPATGA